MQAFNPAQFQANYPAFAGLSTDYLTYMWDNEVQTMGQVIWGLFQPNSNAEYYWATKVLAHCLYLTNGQNNFQQGIGKSGFTSSATEKDVAGNFDMQQSFDSKYWDQSPYGIACYNLLRQRGGFTYFPQSSYNGYRLGYGYNNIWGR